MKKGYKECPFCRNEIKEGAIKCQFCGEFFDGDSCPKKQSEKSKTNFRTYTKYIRVLIILIIIGIFGASKISKEETRQGFYYPENLLEGTEIGGTIFNNYNACKDWALKKYSDGFEAYCSKNCHDSVDGTPICEDVVRTWHPLPGFGAVFEGIPEDRPEPQKACEKPKNNYNMGDKFNQGYQHAKNGGKCDANSDEDWKQGCSFYLFDARNYMACKNSCEILEQFSDERIECIYQGDAWKDVLKDSQVLGQNSCQEPFNDYEEGSEGYRGYEYARNGGECDYTQPFTRFNDACNYYKHEYIQYISCLKGCEVPRNPYRGTNEEGSYRGWEHAFLGIGCSGNEWELGIKHSVAYTVGCERFLTDNKDFIICLVGD